MSFNAFTRGRCAALLAVVAGTIAAACGSSTPPEAAPGAPMNPPKENALLDGFMNETPKPKPTASIRRVDGGLTPEQEAVMAQMMGEGPESSASAVRPRSSGAPSARPRPSASSRPVPSSRPLPTP